MKREIIRTEDGSTTIRLPDWDESYHSKHGAIQEAYHVFIQNGLSLFKGKPLSILEIGFGTGLNALITFVESAAYGPIDYVGVEAYPVSLEEAAMMNYPSELGADCQSIFERMHLAAWDEPVAIGDDFRMTKQNTFFDQIDYSSRFDLIYFDAFGFRVQPELWSAEVFGLMYNALKPGGVLVTYAARTVIRKNMEAAGFRVEKLPGPPGKREMMRAFKEN